MNNRLSLAFFVSAVFLWVGSTAQAQKTAGPVCEGYGPQTPRDIDVTEGLNKRLFSIAPAYQDMNLCNLHFHSHAEHRAEDFSIYAGKGEKGIGGGYQCKDSQSLSAGELKAPESRDCEGVQPGATIEVHWVYSSCDVKPGKTLGSCLSEACTNPNLRVETQVFTLVNDPAALDFATFSYGGHMSNGYHQARSLPAGTGAPVEFLGSTTGPAYTSQACSPLQVTWSVRPECARLDISSLNRWCADNVFEEAHAHGVRELVTDPRLLSPIEAP